MNCSEDYRLSDDHLGYRDTREGGDRHAYTRTKTNAD